VAKPLIERRDGRSSALRTWRVPNSENRHLVDVRPASQDGGHNTESRLAEPSPSKPRRGTDRRPCKSWAPQAATTRRAAQVGADPPRCRDNSR